ncbi:MAG: amidophosphoribosyltransferase [Pseudomonadota bacterium]
MCGIVGLYLKNPELEEQLGALFAPLLVEMTDRGPDSAGIAIFRDDVGADAIKLTVFHPDTDFDWAGLHQAYAGRFDPKARIEHHDSHVVLIADADAEDAVAWLQDQDPRLQVMSRGAAIEIYKETGLADDILSRFAVRRMAGTHAVGHTRMATESAVTTDGSHPFSTGADLCLVHNGSLSNHNRLRARLAKEDGIICRTQNDTEVAAAYISSRLSHGRTLHGALEDCLSALDGFYTFVAGTRDGFAVLRDPIACKPAVLAETNDYVAFASEYRALVSLPGIADANVWEPEPGIVYSWGGSS